MKIYISTHEHYNWLRILIGNIMSFPVYQISYKIYTI